MTGPEHGKTRARAAVEDDDRVALVHDPPGKLEFQSLDFEKETHIVDLNPHHEAPPKGRSFWRHLSNKNPPFRVRIPAIGVSDGVRT
jgi:hypothetical protein